MDFSKLDENIAHPDLVRFAKYCDTLAGDQRMPNRQSLRLSKVPWMAGHIFLVDVLREEGDYYFSLFGILMTKMYGTDFTGQRLSAVGNAELDNAIRTTYDTVVATQAPLYWRGKYRWASQEIKVERLLVPLSDDSGCLSTILGAVCTNVPMDVIALFAGEGPALLVPDDAVAKLDAVN